MKYLLLICLFIITGCDIEYQKVLITEKELTEYPPIIEAIRHIESGGHGPQAASSKGARGSMQVMPATARAMGYHPDEMFDHDKSMEAGSKYYHHLLNDVCGGDVHCALRSYFCGPSKRGMKVCHNYANKVLRKASELGHKSSQPVSKPLRKKKTISVRNEPTVEVSKPWKGYSFAITEESNKKRK